jgi:hypothetical protein
MSLPFTLLYRKYFQLYRLPPVLIVQLKRFQFDYSGDSAGGTKITTAVDYSVDAPLDMSNYVVQQHRIKCADSVVPDSSMLEYELFGIVHHVGVLGGGHYVASVKDTTDILNNDSYFGSKYKSGIEIGKLVQPSTQLDESNDVDLSKASNSSNVKKLPARWFYYNDDEVRLVHDLKTLVSPSAYVLFYLRRDCIGTDIEVIMNRPDIRDFIGKRLNEIGTGTYKNVQLRPNLFDEINPIATAVDNGNRADIRKNIGVDGSSHRILNDGGKEQCAIM